jgi:hypothetical protein
MSGKLICKTCGQPLPALAREGVYLPALKAKIFDFIDAHPGVTVQGIAYHCGISGNAARQHIYQINSLLAATVTHISGNKAWMRGEYQVIRGTKVPLVGKPRKRDRSQAGRKAQEARWLARRAKRPGSP